MPRMIRSPHVKVSLGVVTVQANNELGCVLVSFHDDPALIRKISL